MSVSVILKCLFYYLFLFSWQAAHQHENAGVFPGKMCSDHPKNHGCGQKKPKSTSSTIFSVETASKCCELKRCADWVCNTTDKANLNFSPELYRLIFLPKLNFFIPPKRQLSILLNFFSINKFVFDFCCCLCLFCYNAGQNTISRQKHGIQHRVISIVCHFILVILWCGRTDVRTYGRSRDYYVTTKISWLDRLPNLHSNGAPLTR